MRAAGLTEILQVEEMPGSTCFTVEALSEAQLTSESNVVEDGAEVLDILLRRAVYSSLPRADLNLSRRDGCEGLDMLKCDPSLCGILAGGSSTSHPEANVTRCYALHAKCYLVGGLHRFLQVH